MRSNGDGSRTISKQTQITLGVVLLLATMLIAAVSYAAAQGQLLTGHVADGNIHWNRDSLDDAYMPRGELEARLCEIQRSLKRIESNTRRD